MYPGLQVHPDWSGFGYVLAGQLTQLKELDEKYWLDLRHMHFDLSEFGNDPAGHLLHVPYLA